MSGTNTDRISPGLSVVMATYAGDSPEQLKAAGESVLRQSRVPDELVIVLDGPVGNGIKESIGRLSVLGNVKLVELEHNVGPGGARHQGILAASFGIVAVMDADDVCQPSRFEKQLRAMEAEGADIVGGWIREFNEYPGDSEVVRAVPETHEQIRKYAKRRSPMNNVTIMFRKEAYLAAGGYAAMRCFEDYDLYVRMLLAGARFHNVPEVLVEVRGGQEMFRRRGGIAQIPIETAMLYRMYASGFFSLQEFVSNWVIRTAMRMLPNTARQWAYTIFLRNRA